MPVHVYSASISTHLDTAFHSGETTNNMIDTNTGHVAQADLHVMPGSLDMVELSVQILL